MYREESKKQQKLEDFYMSFGGHLDEGNRWVILSGKVPWKEIEKSIKKSLEIQKWELQQSSLRFINGWSGLRPCSTMQP